MDAINTEGVERVGELNSRTMREAQTDQDFTNAWIAGAKYAYEQAMVFAQERVEAAGPYDDTRALTELVVWCSDQIKETHANPMIRGMRNA